MAGTTEQPDGRLGFWTAVALGKTQSRKAVGPLVAGLRDANDSVRMSAADSLGLLGFAEATEPLVDALTHPNANVRIRAADALGRSRTRAPQLLC